MTTLECKSNKDLTDELKRAIMELTEEECETALRIFKEEFDVPDKKEPQNDGR